MASRTVLHSSMQRIQHAVESILETQLQTRSEELRKSLLTTILQRITRTRIGEYCYNVLCNVHRVE